MKKIKGPIRWEGRADKLMDWILSGATYQKWKPNHDWKPDKIHYLNIPNNDE